MTREELLKFMKESRGRGVWHFTTESGKELSGTDIEDAVIEQLEQEPCEDAISRKAAIEEMECCDFTKSASDDDIALYEYSVIEVLNSLPSVTPKKKMGRWIDSNIVLMVCVGDVVVNLPAKECSICHKPHIRGYGADFCPNCGAKMSEGGQA